MRRRAQDAIRPDNPTRDRDRKVIAADVDTVGVDGEGQVDAIVDDEQRATTSQFGGDLCREGVGRCVVEGFHPELDQADADLRQPRAHL